MALPRNEELAIPALKPRLFNRYVELREIGTGGMARVVLAYDCLLDRHVALKLLRTGEPELMRRLVNEARITARCHHANVVALHEVGEQHGCPYLVLEYLSGQPLSGLLENVWQLPYSRAVELLLPVLRALQHIHAMGVVHRDVKPDNLFVLDSGTPKLLDFGIAKLMPHARGDAGVIRLANLTREGTILGTYEYMSPEQWGGVGVDHLTDIWACGILLHQMICGRHPLHPRAGMQLVMTAMLDMPMPSMSETAPAGVPPDLIDIIDRCLCKQKEQRWQSADELRAALDPFLQCHTPSIRFVRPSERVTMSAPQPAVGAVLTTPHGGAMHARGTQGDLDLDVITPIEVFEPRRPGSPPPPPRVASRPSASSEGAAPVAPEAVARPADRHSILFLAADPAGTEKSALDLQAHDIQVELERSGWRDKFQLVTQWAPESLDLLRALRRRPAIVHFAGSCAEAAEARHGQALVGDRRNGLYLRGRDGRPRLVAPTALDQTFGATGSSVKVVVMSSCYSELQADALLLHVDCVVGMPASHPDVAKAYAIGFYGALGERETVATAHMQGCAAVALEGHESGGCQLKTRAAVDPRTLRVPAVW